ncbi:cell division protein ZapE [Microbacterium rhizophilus]|uniref:cell division protein ZapE n=1 Tax=Microbacterium rhizophilus TaxID=3138934 RepID=UPI0031E8B887
MLPSPPAAELPAPLMRLTLPGLSARTFEDAARRDGFALDEAQRRASRRILASSRSLYLHGPAGRGKTWLMDVAFAAARTPRKRRVHFHAFFPALHAAIFRNGHDLDAALDDLVGDLELLCFDEFHVHDVADGVLVRRLLDALHARDVALVVTSNYAPERLLPNPLFHGTFEPAIADIRARFDVIAIDGGADHRARGGSTGFGSGTWIAGSATRAIGGSHVVRGERDVVVRAVDERILHATFADLCERPLGAADYARLADLRGRWRILEVPPLETLTASAAQRFANLVDVAADRGVRIEFHAGGAPEALADAAVPPLDLPRTLSRLKSLSRGAAS